MCTAGVLYLHFVNNLWVSRLANEFFRPHCITFLSKKKPKQFNGASYLDICGADCADLS
jgi:hypothetical protein